MENHKSFSRIEQKVHHSFRNNLNIADSTEDVKKFFVYAVQDLIEQVFRGKVVVTFDDIRLDQEAEEGFVIDGALRNNSEFLDLLENSDLFQIITRFAESANNHMIHLEEKHPDKTEAKMYPTQSHSGRFHTNKPAKRHGY